MNGDWTVAGNIDQLFENAIEPWKFRLNQDKDNTTFPYSARHPVISSVLNSRPAVNRENDKYFHRHYAVPKYAGGGFVKESSFNPNAPLNALKEIEDSGYSKSKIFAENRARERAIIKKLEHSIANSPSLLPR